MKYLNWIIEFAPVFDASNRLQIRTSLFSHVYVLSKHLGQEQRANKDLTERKPQGDSARYALLTVNHRQGAKNIGNGCKSVRKFEHAVRKYNSECEIHIYAMPVIN